MSSLSKFKLKYPVVMCHGLFGFSKIGPLVYFNGIIGPLQASGIKCEATTVHPTDSIKNRSLALYKQMNDIMKKYNTDRCHLIGHSMGGLDSRYLISNLDQNQSVISLTTLSTPHHGSFIAKWSIENITDRFYIEKLLNKIGIPFGALLDLTPEYCKEFNEIVLDRPDVMYSSYGAYKDKISNYFTPLYYFHKLLLEQEGKNDGLVSLKSSRWSENFKVITNCDHRDLINLSLTYNAFPIYENIIRDLYKLEQQMLVYPKLNSNFILNNNNNNNNNNSLPSLDLNELIKRSNN